MVIMEEFALHLFSGIPNHTEVANICCCTIFVTMFTASSSLYKKYWERLHYADGLLFPSHHSYRKFHSKIQKRPFSSQQSSDQTRPLNQIQTPSFTVQLSTQSIYNIHYICQCMKQSSQCYCHFKELFIYWLIDRRQNSHFQRPQLDYSFFTVKALKMADRSPKLSKSVGNLLQYSSTTDWSGFHFNLLLHVARGLHRYM